MSGKTITRVSQRYIDAPYVLAYVTKDGQISKDFPERRFDAAGNEVQKYETINIPENERTNETH